MSAPAPKPRPQSVKRGKHENPALDQATNNRLMDTPEQNRLAERILIIVGRYLGNAELSHIGGLPWLSQGEAGTGYGMDAIRDMGLSPERLITLWKATVPANENDLSEVDASLLRVAMGNSDCEPGSPATMAVVRKGVPFRRKNTRRGILGQRAVKADHRIRKIGKLLFDDLGRLHLWDEKVREAKGQRREKAVTADIIDIGLYRSAALPRNPWTGELEVDFMAGKTMPVASGGAQIIELSEHRHRKAQSSFDPATAWQATEACREDALEGLNKIRVQLGPSLHEALCDAARGVEFWIIGKGKNNGDWRAAKRGMTAVKQAIEALCEKNSPSEPIG